MSQAMIMPKKRFYDSNGKPLALGKIYTYQAGTTDAPRPTYTTAIGNVENTNPIILNAEGYATIYLDGDYYFDVRDADDNPIWNEDNVSGENTDEWNNCTVPTYVSGTTIELDGNVTDQFSLGRAVRVNNLGTFSTSFITSTSFAAGVTTVVLNDSIITVSSSQICTSILSSDSFTAPEITGGTIDNAPIGETTPSTGNFTKIKVDDGSEALPSISFNSDVDTGIFRPGANRITFVTGGTERILLDDVGVTTFKASAVFADTDTAAGSIFKRTLIEGSQVRDQFNVIGASNQVALTFSRSGTTVGSITHSTTQTNYLTTSDYRIWWKKGKITLSGSSDRIKRIKLYDFPLAKSAGVIAHELQKIIPYAVDGEKDAVDHDGKPIMQGVAYEKTIPDIIGTLQDILSRLEAIEKSAFK